MVGRGQSASSNVSVEAQVENPVSIPIDVASKQSAETQQSIDDGSYGFQSTGKAATFHGVTHPIWEELSTLSSAASFGFDFLKNETGRQLEQEAYTQCDAIPLLLGRLRKREPGKPVDVPPVQSLEEVFGDSFPNIIFTEYKRVSKRGAIRASAHNAHLVLQYWRAMYRLTKPYLCTVLQVLPGLYSLAHILVTQFVIDFAVGQTGGIKLLSAAFCLIFLFLAKQYADFVYQRDVPGGGMRLMFRCMIMRKLTHIQQKSGCAFALSSVGSMLSESVRNAVSIWTALFSMLAHVFGFLVSFSYIVATLSNTRWYLGATFGLFIVVNLACGLWYTARAIHRSHLHNLRRDWRMRYLAGASYLLERHRPEMHEHSVADGLDEDKDRGGQPTSNYSDGICRDSMCKSEPLDDDEIRKQVQESFCRPAMVYRKRAFQRFMYNEATNLCLASISEFNYFGVLIIVGVRLIIESEKGDITVSAGQYAALLQAAWQIATIVNTLYSDISQISENFPYLAQVSEILHFDLSSTSWSQKTTSTVTSSSKTGQENVDTLQHEQDEQAMHAQV